MCIRDRRKATPETLAELSAKGATCTYVEVAGAHDFNAWCQLFTLYVRDYLWQPEAFETVETPDITGLKPGPNVIKDANSPTGYTVKFLYENDEAQSVKFAGDILLRNWEDPSDEKAYNPDEFQPGMMRGGGAFIDDMVNVEDYWYYEVPLTAGANQYWFYIDGNTSYMAPDPNNIPQWSPNSDAATKNAYNAVYVPVSYTHLDGYKRQGRMW